MSTTITLTEEQNQVLQQVLKLLLGVEDAGHGRGLALTSEQYTALYHSRQSSRKLGLLYGRNAHHFNRVWRRLGLDTTLMPSYRKGGGE